MFTLSPLPYSLDALAPYISRETLEYHSGKHHQAYLDNLNKLIVGTPHESLSLEEIVRTASGPIFNNAAQVWNHTFYFEGLGSGSNSVDAPLLFARIEEQWGSFSAFQAAFNDVAMKTFGSGWTWLIQKSDGTLDIHSTSNAGTPLSPQFGGEKYSKDDTPLLVCDVWEHAYYIDTRNARAKYLDNFWQVVNWGKIEERYQK